MDAKELSRQLKEEFDKITPEKRKRIDALRKKAEEMNMFYLVGECPKDSDLSTNGQKKD